MRRALDPGARARERESFCQMETAMMKRYLTLAVAAAILASPAALAASGQTKTNAAAKVATRQASAARQAFGAVPASAAANSAEGAPVARPPAQPGAW